jgi:PTH2 family peptidyl-tRNA hydrolase
MKQVILVRKDLKLPKGKLAAQAAHASLEAVMKTDRRKVDEWRAEGGKKVVLEVADEKELIRYKQLCEDEGLKTALITDAGHTVLAPGTITCLGVGPDGEKNIDKVTGKLKMV